VLVSARPEDGERSAGERTRTSKGFRPTGPKPVAFANSATPAFLGYRVDRRGRYSRCAARNSASAFASERSASFDRKRAALAAWRASAAAA
jgi:hypothetical protein